MRKLLKYVGATIVALVLIQGAYTAYSIATGDARMRETCAGINPGMPFADLRRYSEDHGLRPPVRSLRLQGDAGCGAGHEFGSEFRGLSGYPVSMSSRRERSVIVSSRRTGPMH